MKDKKSVGNMGEELALQYLLGKGLMLMERNWRHNHLEVDLIMLGEDGIHIVEVKTRTAPVLLEPESNVTFRKRHYLLNAASAFVSGHGIDYDTHFDIVSVILNQDGPEIDYLPDAFTQFD